LLKQTLSFLVFENVFIALCAVAMVQVTIDVMNLPPFRASTGCFVFFSTLLVYNLHKSLSLLRGQTPGAVWELVTSSQLTPGARLLIYSGSIGAAVSFCFLLTAQQLLVAGLACVTLAYSFPILKINNSRRRIRELFFIKVLVISGVWSLVTVLLPVLGSHFSSASFWMLFCERILFVFAITIPFEIRDVEQEKKWGNKTLPVVLGPERSKTLAFILVALFSLLAGIHYLVYPPTVPALAFAMFLSAVSAVIVIYHTHENQNNLYYKLYVDGTMMLQYIFVTLLIRL
jgi:4-hydroxybenzoate polyprenyltransferase